MSLQWIPNILIAFVIYKKIKDAQDFRIKSVTVILVSIVTIALNIVLSVLSEPDNVEPSLFVYSYLVATFIGCLAFFLLLVANIKQSALFSRIDETKRMWVEDRKNYEIEKEALNQFAIKTHDLKHFVRSLKGEINQTELDKIDDILSGIGYNYLYETGSLALDVKTAIDSVNPDLFGVQEEGDGWVNALKPYYEGKGYTHIYTTRGGSFSEASGIFVRNSRFEILDSGTFWFASSTSNQSKSGYIASEWGALYPRICSWAKLKDKTNNKELSYFNAHFEYNHAFGSAADATSDSNTIFCRTSSVKQIINKAKALGVPSIFTGDLNYFRTETQTYNQCLSYFDDVWALNKTAENDMCSFHDYGKELNPSTRTHPYTPIDYIYTSKTDWVSSSFTIMSNQGTKESDFDSDHFFVYADIDYAQSTVSE